MAQSKKLKRNTKDKFIAGVCSGLAQYFEVDVTIVRVIFVIASALGISPLVYIVLWILIPAK